MNTSAWGVILLVALFHVTGTLCSGCAGFKVLRKGGLTCEDRRVILDTHNRLRQSVALGKIRNQPGASNMVELVWDEELAAIAQKWANTCSNNHDAYRDVKRFSVGQNIAASWTTMRPYSEYDYQPDFVEPINSWFDEVAYYRMNDWYSGQTGHYTQIVWSGTYVVGCGYNFFWDPRRGYVKNYVCNYGPTGNILGRPPYISGQQSCDRYGMWNSKSLYGLCSKKASLYPLGPSCSSYYGYA